MVIDTAKLKVSTKTIVGFLLSFAGFMQIPAVSQMVLTLTAQHKGFASFVGAVSAIGLLLHNPEVQDALGIEDAQ